jgi:hypothetical protein
MAKGKPAPKKHTGLVYISDMRAEAAKRRKDADEAFTNEDRVWHLNRAAFFEECANEAEAKQARELATTAE